VKVYDGNGAPVVLGSELGRGGEGAVFTVADHADLVAKIYHQRIDPMRADKLRTMVGMRTDPLLKIAAWPIQTLHPSPGGAVSGSLMPKVSGYKPIHFLYGPKSRVVEFPNATFPFLVHTATNLARAFAVIHTHNQVVGDVNESNIMISQQGMVKLIDCDSFQIISNGHQYLCEVGVQTHQPPEMLSLPSFRGVVRTTNQDNFGLAVLIFQLLMMGRHPFAGRYLGSGEMPVEKAIKERRFAYGSQAAQRQIMSPPSSLPLEVLSAPIATLFENAFTADGLSNSPRPDAAQWVAALEALAKNLRTCTRNSKHSFLINLKTCPLCDIETRVGILLFTVTGSKSIPGAATIDMAAIWTEIVAVKSPGPAPALPSYTSITASISLDTQAKGRRRRVRNTLGAIIMVMGVVAWAASNVFWLFVIIAIFGLAVADLRNADRHEAKQRLDQAIINWERLKERWEKEAGDIEFKQKRQELEKTRDELAALPEKRRKKFAELLARCRETALHRYLEKHLIATAKIENVGTGRKATLRSYGIETAADITRSAVLAVPGFGKALTTNLLAWRGVVEQTFVFDPTKGVDPRDIAALDNELYTTRARLEHLLRSGATQLTLIEQNTEWRRQSLWPVVNQAVEGLASADATWRAL
jgi:DNA-binding helix-hairpin-helix protein with protein kinase domain